ncbi:MAG TPA: bifunctional diguanylate cyclase/phosphodiesterase, partial [Ilumatobacteraceae bacterium]
TLFFIDLDRFKNINDSLGHAAGDRVLCTIADRLRATVPERATVARISGDEYVVLDPASPSLEAAMELANELLEEFRNPLPLAAGDVFVTASIGVARSEPQSHRSADVLLRHADTAMYQAKDAGRNCVALFDETMHERVSHRLTVETALFRALDRRELRMYHQPILEITTGDVAGFEALMRWQQGDGTIVSPAEFIPIAEETGTIIPIGAWALTEALAQLRSWVDDGICSPTATMSVNVSPRQLADANFPSIVHEALLTSRVSPHQLWLEVTEGIMITEPELALASLRRLRSLGVRVALDDFGTGYSSLSLLQKFPLQRIKIDRAFVQGVADNSNDRALVRTIIAMALSLGLDMVAEGVETVQQLQVLAELGCTKAQGYLISHPVPPDAMRSTVSALERMGAWPGINRTREPVFAAKPEPELAL